MWRNVSANQSAQEEEDGEYPDEEYLLACAAKVHDSMQGVLTMQRQNIIPDAHELLVLAASSTDERQRRLLLLERDLKFENCRQTLDSLKEKHRERRM